MYSDVAYINEQNDFSHPLSIKSCGYYRFYSLKTTTSERPNGRSDFQLIYIASGKTHFFFDGTEHILAEGTFILYRPGQPQKYTYRAEDKPEVFWIHFSGSEVDAILDRYGLGKETVFHTTTSKDLNNLFFLLIHESQQPDENYNRLSSLLLRSLFLFVSKGIPLSTEDPDLLNSAESAADPQYVISRAVKYFNRHYMDEINIEKFAADNHMSPCWFIRSFKKHIGTTPRQHIISARVINAQSLLESTDLSVSKISSMVGYDDSRYFSRIFKKQTGFSPEEYRKKRI